jgi:hypothetical protein
MFLVPMHCQQYLLVIVILVYVTMDSFRMFCSTVHNIWNDKLLSIKFKYLNQLSEYLLLVFQLHAINSFGAGLPDLYWYNLPKRETIFQITICKIYQMTIKYTNIFHCKSFRNLPKLGFLVWKMPSGNPV